MIVCNLSFWGRIIRLIFGILLLSWAFAGGPFWAYLGIYLIITAGWGFCPILIIFKKKSL